MKKSQTRKTVTLPQTSKKLRKQSQKLFHIEENLRLTRHRIADLMDDIALLKRDLKGKETTNQLLWKSLFKLSEKGATTDQTVSLLFGLYTTLSGCLLWFAAKILTNPYLFWSASIIGTILVISGFYQIYKSTNED